MAMPNLLRPLYQRLKWWVIGEAISRELDQMDAKHLASDLHTLIVSKFESKQATIVQRKLTGQLRLLLEALEAWP